MSVGSRDEILENLAAIQVGMRRGAARADRDPAEIMLVAAAKTVPAEAIGWVVEAGVVAVGENYIQELRAKHDHVPGAEWHFIGTLQASSAHHVAALADVVETVTGDHATERMARRAAEAGRTIDVLIEVDLTGERTGVVAQDVGDVADRLVAMEGVHLRGLMTLPPIPATPEDARPWFVTLRELRDRVRERHQEVLELSMGMSLDYEVAVEEGATMVRVGTALFGPRTP